MSHDNNDDKKSLVVQGLSRRGLPKYDHNPSLEIAAKSTHAGVRRLANKSGDKLMIVSEGGEILAPAGFYEVLDVDKTRFVKLYASGVKAFQGLSAAGGRVFELIYGVVIDSPKTDRFTIHYEHFKHTGISAATFKRGMKELLEKEFLYESIVTNEYWLNISYIFNGNRLAFIKEYRLVESNEKGRKQQSLPLFDREIT